MSRRTPGLVLVAVAATTVAIAGAPAAQARAADRTPPGPVTAVSIDGHTTSSTKASLTVSWKKPTARDLKSVTVYRNSTATLTGAKSFGPTTASHFTDRTVLPNRTYWYFLRAADKAGNKSAFARIVTRTSSSATERVLAGVITDAKGTGLHGLDVQLNRGNTYLDDAETSSSGVFVFAHAAYSARGLSVCWYNSTGIGGIGNTTGYLRGCYNNHSDANPKNATRVPLVAGEFRGISVTAHSGARLTGTVQSAGGTALSDVDVELYDADGDEVDDVSTQSSGRFSFTSVPAGSAYTVQLDASNADLDKAPTGYVSQWVGGAPAQSYSPGTVLPKSGVTAFTLKAAATTTVATTKLVVGGAVTGSATGSAEIGIGVYDAAGNRVARAFAGSDEGGDDPTAFSVVGVPSGTYTVCANDYDGDAESQCWTGSTDVDWDGDTSNLPKAAAGKVSVTAGATVSGVRFALQEPGDIEGHVAGVADGSFADVQAFDTDGKLVDDGGVDPDDPSFRLELAAGSYTVCATLDGPDIDPAYQCRTQTGDTAWDGKAADLPAAAVEAVTVVAGTSTTGVDFDFSK